MIEKYKSPTGDGNSIAHLRLYANLIEKYKSPTGDGNYENDIVNVFADY